MKVGASVFIAPAGVVVAGWVWVALGYRLAFHGFPPETGFYKRTQGPNLERWLFDAPVLFVLVGLAFLALVVGHAWFRQRRIGLALVFLLECLAFACAFAAPVIWFIDIKGSGGVFF